MIQLDRHYQNINGVKLAPDTYEDNDPRLKGLGDYLVDTGFATRIKSKSSKAENHENESLDEKEPSKHRSRK